MGLKRKIKNFLYVKKHYPLVSQDVEYDINKKTIIIIDALIPAFDKDSGSNRITEIATFLGKYYNVFLMHWFKQIPKAEHKKYIENFSNNNVVVYTPFINKYGVMRGKKYFLKTLIPKIDFVWCHGPKSLENYLDFFRKKAPQATIIYDMIDIHFLRMERSQHVNYNEKALKEIKYYQFIETELSKKADKISVISDLEKKVMKSYIEESKLFTISNIHNLKRKSSDLQPFKKRKGIFFIGSFLHEPNVDAVIYLYNKIMPHIWKTLPTLKMTIIGQFPPEEITKMDSEFFQIKGYVEDVIPYYENSIASISPLRFGAGVKGKIGQALEYSLPVVTTEIGAEGMFLENRVTALISDNEDYIQFAKNVIEICTNEPAWNTISHNSEKAIFPFTVEAQKDTLFRLLS